MSNKTSSSILTAKFNAKINAGSLRGVFRIIRVYVLNIRQLTKKVLLFLFLIVSCKGEKNNSEILKINIKDIETKSINVNEIFTNIDFVVLETLPECLLVENDMEVYLTDRYIIANNGIFRGGGVYLFDRKTGKFLYEIGKKGQGPGEYNLIFPKAFNEKYELFYVVRNLQRIGIDINTNKEVERVFHPVSTETVLLEMNRLNVSIVNIYKMDSFHYIAYPNNETGNDPYLLVIFDKEGNIVKTYPNHQKYVNYHKERSDFNPGLFYEFKNHLFFKEHFFNDTVFHVNIDTIIPHIIFDLGKMKPDYKERENPDKNRNCYWISYVRETTNYIFFSYYKDNDGYYDGYYNKRARQLSASLSGSKENRGFVHDNNLYPPFHISYINKSEEVAGIITASSMLDYMNKNEQTVYPELFGNLKYDDNPIVVIAKLK